MFETFFGRHKSKEERFTESYHLSFDYVYAFVFARTAGDALLTEEIVQQTYVAAWIGADRFLNRSSYTTWLCSIARNKLREAYRQKATSFVPLPDDVGGADVLPVEDAGGVCVEMLCGMDTENIVMQKEVRETVAAALMLLIPEYRYTLIMKYIDGYSVKEIASTLCRTPKAVDGMLQRARAAFARHYLKLSGIYDRKVGGSDEKG